MSYGYDYEPESGSGGVFLSLKKGSSPITVRLASKFEVGFRHWLSSQNKYAQCHRPTKDEREAYKTKHNKEIKNECPYCGDDLVKDERVALNEIFAWKVIDRQDGKPKIFSGPKSVFLDIKKLAEHKNWGDPTEYDIEISRVDGERTVYEVIADPRSLGKPLTKEELEALEKANFDLKKAVRTDKPSKTEAGNLETMPEDDEVIDPSTDLKEPEAPEKDEDPYDDIPF